MSEFRHGRRRFISRDPLKEEKWNCEYESKTRRSNRGRDFGTTITQSNSFDALTSDPSHVTNRSSQLPSSPSTGSSKFYSFRLPDDRDVTTDRVAARSRDRSTLRGVTTRETLRAADESRMTSEIRSFRPIHRRHSGSSSSSDGEPGDRPNASTTKPLSLASVHQDIRSFNTVGQSGTFLTLPANADSMHVQIQDTQISITRIPDVSSLEPASRMCRQETNNCQGPENILPNADTSSTKCVPLPATSVSRASDHPTQRSPVRGLRLVPSPNSAFTKTKSTKVSKLPEKKQFQANHLPTASRASDPDRPVENSDVNPNTKFSLFDDHVWSQNPIDFAQILSGFWLRPADTDPPLSPKPQKSSSLGSLVPGGNETEKSAKNDSKYAFENPQSMISKNGTDTHGLSTLRTILKPDFYTSQVNKPTGERKTRNSFLEIGLQSQLNDISEVGNPKSNLFVSQSSVTLVPDKSSSRSLVFQPMANAIASDVSASQPITNSLSNLFTATLRQPIEFIVPCQPTLENSYNPITTRLFKSEATPHVYSNDDHRPITVSTTFCGKVNDLTSLPTSSLSSVSATLPSSRDIGSRCDEALSMASAIDNLEKAISMLNSVAMDPRAPGDPVTLSPTFGTDVRSKAYSFQLVRPTGMGETVIETTTDTSEDKDSITPGKTVIERSVEAQSRVPKSAVGSTTLPLASDNQGVLNSPIRQDAILTVTLNLLDQTLAEIHQEFPPDRAVEFKRRSKSFRSGSKDLDRLDLTSKIGIPFWEIPRSTSHRRQSLDEESFWPLNPSASDHDADPQSLKRVLDREDSFNRPGSAIHVEPLPLPKDSVIQRHRRKKKNKSSASPSSSSASSSSSSGEPVTGDGRSTSASATTGVKRSTRSLHPRRQKLAKRPEDGVSSSAANDVTGDNKAKNRTGCRTQRGEEKLLHDTSEVVRHHEDSDENDETHPPTKFFEDQFEVRQSVRRSVGRSTIDCRSRTTPPSTASGAEGQTTTSTTTPPDLARLTSFSSALSSLFQGSRTDDNKKCNDNDDCPETENPTPFVVGKNFRKPEEEDEDDEEEEEEFHDSHSRLSSVSPSRISASFPSAMHSSSVTRLAEKPETVKSPRDVRARDVTTVSPTNTTRDRFELSRVEVSRASAFNSDENRNYDVVSPAKMSSDPSSEDRKTQVLDQEITRMDYICSGVTKSSPEGDPGARAETISSPVTGVSLEQDLEKSANENIEGTRDGVFSNEEDQEVVYKTRSLEPKGKDAEHFGPQAEVDSPEIVSKIPPPTEASKQANSSSDEDEEETSSLVELSLDKIDEECRSDSSHGSMEIHDDDQATNNEVRFLSGKSEHLPPDTEDLTDGKDIRGESSSSNRRTMVRFGDDQSPPGSADPVDKGCSSLDRMTSSSILKNSTKPCIVRKQLIHLDSALHPSSCVPPESKPVESRWSPKLMRKLNLDDARDVDVSDLNVDPDLMDFLSQQIDRAAAERKLDQTHRDDEDGDKMAPDMSRLMAQRKPIEGQLSKFDRDRTQSSSAEAKKPEVEKRKFFSALKANTASLRAKLGCGGMEDRSQDRGPLDRLASFAIISDVGIGSKRRQFQRVGSAATDAGESTTPLAVSGIEVDESPRSGEVPRPTATSAKTTEAAGASLPRTSSKAPAETRPRGDEESKTRQGRPEVYSDDDDDDLDLLVEINSRELAEERPNEPPDPSTSSLPMNRTKPSFSKSFTRSASIDRTSSDRTESVAVGTDQHRLSFGTKSTNESSRPSLEDRIKRLREKLKSGGESAHKFQVPRRQLSRFKTQPITIDEVVKASGTTPHKNAPEK